MPDKLLTMTSQVIQQIADEHLGDMRGALKRIRVVHATRRFGAIVEITNDISMAFWSATHTELADDFERAMPGLLALLEMRRGAT